MACHYTSLSFHYCLVSAPMMLMIFLWFATNSNSLLFIRVTSLVIFYYFNPAFGEMWTRYSCLQIVGAVILIYGTAIYNAPNYGSILLEGQWWALRINLSAEYAAIRQDQMANVDAHFMYENLAEEYDAIVHEEGAKTVHSFGR